MDEVNFGIMNMDCNFLSSILAFREFIANFIFLNVLMCNDCTYAFPVCNSAWLENKRGFFFLVISNIQMALIARIQHPYIVEFKEAWVEKVIVLEIDSCSFVP